MQPAPDLQSTYETARHGTGIYKTMVNDLISSIESEIELKKGELESYEERLSTLLRNLERNPALSENPLMNDLRTLNKSGKIKANGNADKDWLRYQNLMLYRGDPKLGEAQMYFDSLGALRDEIFTLTEIAKAFKTLLGSGLSKETRCSVFYKDGVPVKFVLQSSEEVATAKMSFQGHFLIE